MKPIAMATAAILSAVCCVAAAQTTRPVDDDLATCVAEGIVNAPADEMWRVFSTADGYKKLGVAQAKIDLRPGGMLWTSYDPQAVLGSAQSIGTEILAIDPGRCIATHIVHPPEGFPFTTAYKTVTNVVTITDLGDGRSDVRIAMNGYDASDESQKMRDFFKTGNPWVLKKLQASYGGESPKGAAHAEGPLDTVEITRVIDAPREDVWRAFITPEGWKIFLDRDHVNIGKLPGEPFAPFPGTEGDTILAVVPGEMFSYTWNAPPRFEFAKDKHSWVVVTFDAVSPTTTRVRLRHYGLAELATKYPEHADEFKACRTYFAEKWPMVLDALATHFKKQATPSS